MHAVAVEPAAERERTTSYAAPTVVAGRPARHLSAKAATARPLDVGELTTEPAAFRVERAQFTGRSLGELAEVQADVQLGEAQVVATRIQKAVALRSRGQMIQSLRVLEAAFRDYPEYTALEETFRTFLTEALYQIGGAARAQAIVILQKSDRAWAKQLLADWEQFSASQRTGIQGMPQTISARPHAAPPVAPRQTIASPTYARPQPLPATAPLVRPRETPPPRVAAIASSAQAGTARPYRSQPRSEPLRYPSVNQPPPRRPPAATPLAISAPRRILQILGEALAVLLSGLPKGLSLMFFSLILGALLGAVVGAISAAGMGAYLHAGEGGWWQLWFALLSALAGLLAGALGGALGGAGAGLTVGTLISGLRARHRISRYTHVPATTLSTVAGGVSVLAAFLLSGATGLTLLTLLLRVLPSQPHIVGLWIVWGALGGLVCGALFRSEL